MSVATPGPIEEMRANFLSIINRPLVPQPQITSTDGPLVEKGIIYEKVLLQTEEHEYAPLLIAQVRPHSGDDDGLMT